MINSLGKTDDFTKTHKSIDKKYVIKTYKIMNKNILFYKYDQFINNTTLFYKHDKFI